MKTTIIILVFLLISGVTYSQIHYISVSPKYEENFEKAEGRFDNVSCFLFSINSVESIKAEYCHITGYLSDFPLENRIDVKTGWDYEYTEDQTQADSTGYFEAVVTTGNLPTLLINIFYSGEPLKVKLNNVDIYFTGSRF